MRDMSTPPPLSHIYARLQAELQGALPPPGAPPGALAPINPRASCPVYVADLTTEVLSADSQEVRETLLSYRTDCDLLDDLDQLLADSHGVRVLACMVLVLRAYGPAAVRPCNLDCMHMIPRSREDHLL